MNTQKHIVAFNAMPSEFTTNEFMAELRKIGVDESIVKSGYHLRFIKSNCIKISNRRYKKTPQPNLSLFLDGNNQEEDKSPGQEPESLAFTE